MVRASFILSIPLLMTLLIGCQPESDPAAASSEASEATRSERREALRERFAELERPGAQGPDAEAGEQDGEAPPDRRRRGEPTPAARWWEQEALIRDLGLSDEQLAEISEARAQLAAALRRSRQSLADATRELRQALAANDQDRVEQLLASRVAALEGRARAEAAWTRRLQGILEDEQLERLAEQHPMVLARLVAPVRGRP